MSSNTQLTDLKTLDVSKLRFEAKKETVAGDKNSNAKPLEYIKIWIKIQNPDKTIGDFIFKLPSRFCFGLKPSTSPGSDEVKGHEVCLCMETRGGATEEEKLYLDRLADFRDCAKEWMKNNYQKLGADYDEPSTLRKLDTMIYYKKDPKDIKKRAADATAMYTVKVNSFKKDDTWDFKTMFHEKDLATGEVSEVSDPMSYVGKMTNVVTVVHIPSIYVGSNKPSVQSKLYQCVWEKQDTTTKNFLTELNGTTSSSVQSSVSNNTAVSPEKPITRNPESLAVQFEDDDEDATMKDTADEDTLQNSDVEDVKEEAEADEEVEPEPKKKPTVKRAAKKATA